MDEKPMSIDLPSTVRAQPPVASSARLSGAVHNRERLAARGVGSSADIQHGTHGQAVRIAGAIVVKQHPETAKGHVFLSLEDEYGLVNVIIRPATYAAYKRVVDQGGAVVIQGTLQHVDGVISVLARHLEELSLFVKLISRDWQ